MFLPDDKLRHWTERRQVWIGGLVLAFSTAVLFGFSIYLGTPPVDNFFLPSVLSQ
jgi:hypothetical protein